MEPKNYRDVDCCLYCKFSRCISFGGGCPSEFECIKYENYFLGSGELYVCDDFEEDS